MENEKRIILQCKSCKKLFKISKARWENLLVKWGSPQNVVENYLCKSCSTILPLSPTVSQDNIFREHCSPEEEIIFQQTVDNQPFNKTAVKNLLNKISLYRQLFSQNKVKVVSQEELKRFNQLYNEQQEKLEKDSQEEEKE